MKPVSISKHNFYVYELVIHPSASKLGEQERTTQLNFNPPNMTSPKPKVAILDDYQNISAPLFQPLASQVSISHYPDTLNPRHESQKQALIDRLQPYNVIVTMRERTPFSADIISSLPNLKLLLTSGMRNLALDLDAFAKRGITVAGTVGRPPGVNSTVQHTWALILALARNVARDDAAVKRGEWQGSLAINLSGKTLALLGLGKLGSEVGKIAVLAFGMKVIAWSSNLTQEKADAQARDHGLPAGSFAVIPSKAEFFQRADVLSIHNVLSERSRGIVGVADLSVMKPSALVVNTSRGPLIDEGALLEALNTGLIRGAALDVFDTEPLPTDSAWRTTAWGKDGRSEVLLTPHMGYGEEELLHGWYKEMATNLGKWLNGQELETKMN